MKRSNGTKRLKTEGGASNQPGPSKQQQPIQIGGGGEKGGTENGLFQFREAHTIPVTANPLQNSLILNHLFKLCPPEMLTNCRLVCKLWYQESLRIWRTDCPITLALEENKTDKLVSVNHGKISYELGWKSAAHLRLHRLLTYCRNPKNGCSTKPYRSLKLLSSPKYRQVNLFPSKFPNLWDALGCNLTTLHLLRCGFNGPKDFRTFVFTVCPNLQTLKFEDCVIFAKVRLELDTVLEEKRLVEYKEPLHGRKLHLKTLKILCWNPEFGRVVPWLEVFSHFRSLTHFSFRDSTEKSEFVLLMEAMISLRKHDPRALPLQLVEIFPAPDISGCDPKSQKETELVKELRLPLKSLCIHVQPGMDERSVKTILSFHAKTVRVVKVMGNPKAVLYDMFTFGVHLNQLTTLEIAKHLTQTFAFLNYTPNLELLIISGDPATGITSIPNSCKEEMAHVRMVHLERLRLDSVLTDQDLACLFEWIPSLTTLHGLVLNDKQFGNVCRNWKDLTSLLVNGDQLTDVGVTGIRKGRKGKKMAVAHPNITDLQNLEEFEYSDNGLTEESVFHGFLKLPRLREIKFSKDDVDNPGWGRDARMALKEKKIALHESPCRHCPGWGCYYCQSDIVNRFHRQQDI